MAQTSQVGKRSTTISTNELGQTQVVYHSTPVLQTVSLLAPYFINILNASAFPLAVAKQVRG